MFVKPALELLSGSGETGANRMPVGILMTKQPSNRRTTYFPATKSVNEDGEVTVDLLSWKGSADLRTVADATCLAILPADEELHVGKMIRFMPVDS